MGGGASRVPDTPDSPPSRGMRAIAALKRSGASLGSPRSAANYGQAKWAWAVSGSSDNSVIVWDYVSGKSKRKLSGATARSDGGVPMLGKAAAAAAGHVERVRCVAVSRNGSWIASGSVDNTVRIWEVATGVCRRVLQGHGNTVWTVALTRDGHNIFSGAHKEFFMWDRRNGERVGEFEGYEERERESRVGCDRQSVV